MLNHKLALIDEILQNIDGNLLPDDAKAKLAELQEHIQNLRDTTLMIEQTKQVITLFKDVILAKIKQATVFIPQIMAGFKTKEEMIKQLHAGNTQIITHVSKALVIISDMVEMLVMKLYKNMNHISLIFAFFHSSTSS